MNKFSRFVSSNLGNDVGKSGIACNVERHSQKHVSASLVQKTRKLISRNFVPLLRRALPGFNGRGQPKKEKINMKPKI